MRTLRIPASSARQRGFSLAEVLVVVALLMVVTTIVAGAVLTANKTTRRTADAALTQAQILDSVSRMSREVALADPIVSAAPNRLELQTTRADKCLRTAFYLVDPTDTAAVSALSTKAKNAVNALPAPAKQSRVILQDTYASTSATCMAFTVEPTASDVLVTNVTLSEVSDPNLEADRANVLFNYFDAGGGFIKFVNQSGKWVIADPAGIDRVGMNVKAKALDRKNGLSLTTSVAPRMKLPAGTNIDDLPAPAKPQLFGVIAPGTRDAQLSWNKVLGATGYILLGDQAPAAPATTKFTAPDTNTLSWVDAALPWGETQNYQVIVTGLGGNTPSNIVALTVVPNCVSINAATTKALAGDPDGLINDIDIRWAAPAGSKLDGFRVYRTGTATKIADLPATATNYVDKNRPAGTNSTYRVTGYNSGGEGANCNTATRIAASAAPTLTASVPVNTNTVNLSWNAVAGATRYHLYYGGSTSPFWSGTATTAAHNGVAWGADHGYQVRAENTAGLSPLSNQAVGRVGPGPFDIVAGDTRQHAKYTNKDGAVVMNQQSGSKVGWTWAAGAANYEVHFWGHGGDWRWNVGGGTWSTGDYDNAVPGATYAYEIIARSPNGVARVTPAKTVLIPPTGPAHVDARTFCKKPLQMTGWKYGFNAYPWPSWGYFDLVRVSEEKFEVWTPDGPSSGGYKWHQWTAINDWAPQQAWVYHAWGGLWNDGMLLSNQRGFGGGIWGQSHKYGSANFGNNWSVQLGTGAWKVATGGVTCPDTATTWRYNGNWVPVTIWNYF